MKPVKCRDCGGKTRTYTVEALGLDSVLRKELAVQCLDCNVKYTEPIE